MCIRDSVGAVYTLGHTLHGDAYKYHQTGTESNGSIYVQSQTGDTIPNPFKMPHTFGAGLTYVYDNRLTIGVCLLYTSLYRDCNILCKAVITSFLIKRCVKSNSAIVLLQSSDSFDNYFKF